MIPEETLFRGKAFLGLMKRYVVNYTNAHDQSQTVSIMEDDYLLRMGDHLVRGRDADYAIATRKQLDQFPGLGLTVHEIWTSGERLAMRFSEHGASLRHGGNRASWGGIGLYSWNGAKLTANNVEQDYLSRARQLKSGQPLSVESPAIAPWDTEPEPADPRAVAIVDQWLKNGGIDRTRDVQHDDQWAGVASSPLLDQREIIVNDIFSCGPAVAFHATQVGRVIGDAGPAEALTPDVEGRLHMAGIVHVDQDRVARGRIIRNRLDLERTLARS